MPAELDISATPTKANAFDTFWSEMRSHSLQRESWASEASKRPQEFADATGKERTSWLQIETFWSSWVWSTIAWVTVWEGSDEDS